MATNNLRLYSCNFVGNLSYPKRIRLNCYGSPLRVNICLCGFPAGLLPRKRTVYWQKQHRPRRNPCALSRFKLRHLWLGRTVLRPLAYPYHASANFHVTKRNRACAVVSRVYAATQTSPTSSAGTAASKRLKFSPRQLRTLHRAASF